MNCREVSRLLPLWIGRDLADTSEAEVLRGHLGECAECADRRLRLQQSLEALQSVSTGLEAETLVGQRRPSLWPQLASRLGGVPRRRDRFNGWIPAAAMTLAAGVMVSVSIVQFQREMGDTDPSAFNVPSFQVPVSDRAEVRDLFNSDRRFSLGAPDRDIPVRGLVKQPATNNW